MGNGFLFGDKTAGAGR